MRPAIDPWKIPSAADPLGLTPEQRAVSEKSRRLLDAAWSVVR